MIDLLAYFKIGLLVSLVIGLLVCLAVDLLVCLSVVLLVRLAVGLLIRSAIGLLLRLPRKSYFTLKFTNINNGLSSIVQWIIVNSAVSCRYSVGCFGYNNLLVKHCFNWI